MRACVGAGEGEGGQRLWDILTVALKIHFQGNDSDHYKSSVQSLTLPLSHYFLALYVLELSACIADQYCEGRWRNL